MPKFRGAVRAGKVRGPQQIGFDLGNWSRAFTEFNDGSQEDLRLFQSGKWFADEFAQVRKITQFALAEFAVTEEVQKLSLVGYSIWTWLELRRQIEDHMQHIGSDISIADLQRVPLQSAFYSEANPTALIESLVDGLRFPLSAPINQGSDKRQVSGLGKLKALQKLALAGQHYHVLEQCWLDCIWNDYFVRESKKEVAIVAANPEFERRRAASEYRRLSITFESTQRGAAYSLHNIPPNIRAEILNRRGVLRVFRRSGGFRLRIGAPNHVNEDMLALPITRAMIIPEHVMPLLAERLEPFEYLTLEEILDAYHLLSHIVDQLPKWLEQENLYSIESLLEWTPRFQTCQLLGAFQNAFGISSIQAECLLDLMTHSGSVRDQLWFKPLIRISKDEFTIVTAALDGVNYARLIDWILARCPKLELSLGKQFEERVYVDWTEAIESSRLRKVSSLCTKPSLVFTVGATTEEIDNAFAVGSYLFVCELKSAAFAVEPLEHSHYKAKLDAAAQQAKRKATFVAAHWEAFLDQSGIKLIGNGVRPDIHPLIVTSAPLFAGITWDGVPVVDSFIVERFFIGYLDHLAYENDQGHFVPTVRQVFYGSIASAVRNSVDYFKNPPQLRNLEGYVVRRDTNLPICRENDAPRIIQAYEVELPMTELRQFGRLRKGDPKR
jgi:hypothetical protein